MSAKWRALQHRHRYTYNAVIFPQTYLDSLTQLQLQLKPHHGFVVTAQTFISDLQQLVSLTSIYTQVTHVKKLASSFTNLVSLANTNANGNSEENGDTNLLSVANGIANGKFEDNGIGNEEGLVGLACKLYLEILFLDNSLPLHKTLLSGLSKLSSRVSCNTNKTKTTIDSQRVARSEGSSCSDSNSNSSSNRKKKSWDVVIVGCFRSLCDEYYYGGKGKGRRFCVSRVALSMMSTPKLGYLVEVVEECCVMVGLDVVNGLNSVVGETKSNVLARPSPLVMEQCQEGLSCLYYLLQRFPSKFVEGDEGDRRDGCVQNLMGMVVKVILCILKSSAFSRDCFVAAGVSFCAALQVLLSPNELGLLILEAVFGQKVGGRCDSEYKNVYEMDLCVELGKLSPLSRLCLLRGILTAVSRTVLSFQFDKLDNGGTGTCGASVQTILYDAILPELCRYCENPADSHFNFHALTVMQICLQQIKTSIIAGGDASDVNSNFSAAIPEDLGARIIRIIWNNLEDPLSQTVKQVHLIFDLYLDIKSVLHGVGDSVGMGLFLRKLAADLLCLGPRCKGRYIPLASLTRRLGAKTILDMSSNLVFETVHAYIDDDVCCAATSFFKCFLECLRDECWNDHGVEKGYEIYRSHCLPAFLNGLACGITKMRSNLNTYALPCLLEVDVDSIFPLFSFISIETTGLLYPTCCSDVAYTVEQKVAVLVSLLKVSRSLALFEGDIDVDSGCSTLVPSEDGVGHAFIHIKGVRVEIPVQWLAIALTHVDESLRVDAAESLFLNPKTASLPSPLELKLMRMAVPLNMRCSSTAFQMKWASLFKKFFARVRTSLERQFKQGIWKPYDKGIIRCSEDEIIPSRAEDLYQFMKWLSCFLFSSCYPSAPYQRRIMAMELIMIMINVWSIVPPSQGTSENLYPYNEGITKPDSTMLLLGAIVDSWDRLRENSFHILLKFPTPLPGISSEYMVHEVIQWAKKLVCSPRVRESDAGALTLRLIFRKYVVELGWKVGSSVSPAFNKTKKSELRQNGECPVSKSRHPVIEYINSLMDWLQTVVEEGEKDLLEACKNSFVHGILLAMRYTFEELDWNSDVVTSSISEIRYALGRVLDLVMQITSLALWVVSADAWYLPQDMDDVDEDSLLLQIPNEMDMPADEDSKVGRNNVNIVEDARPTEQIIMVGCWLAMKEVSLLLGTIIRKIPLPSAASSVSEEPVDDGMGYSAPMSDTVLDVTQLETIGDHFLEVLLKMKHNGAIDKTRAGFTALCNRLLCSDDPRLCQLVESWMDQLMERTAAKGQTVDDLLRRSAGIPAAFSALFLAEPQGAPKKMLPRALRWLIDVAGGSLLDQTPESKSNMGSSDAGVSDACQQMYGNSKIRDEGIIPTVHAFNVLRAAFNDTNLATDTSGFSAEAMIISIRSFSSPHWEIRNSACLAYTALVRRMIGFLNVHKRESARRAITSLEFFHRYPQLHSFVFDELKVATELLVGKSKSTLASTVHPSICPVLILLSRLKPSPIASEVGDQLDPFRFMPFIQRCSTQSNMRIRILASRALRSLVSNEKLHMVLLDIASAMPNSSCHQAELASDRCSFNSIHGILLQLGALLDVNCRNLAEFSARDVILDDLIKILDKCSWLGSPRLCPCPTVNTCFLRVLDHMLSIAGMRKNYDAIRSLLSKVSSECLVARKSANESSFHDPTVAELEKQAAISFFHCVYHLNEEEHGAEGNILCTASPANLMITKDNVKEKLICHMSDASYEVRLATFKWLLQFVKNPPAINFGDDPSGGTEVAAGLIAHWAKSDLQPTLIRLLSLETHHKCTCYILRILFAWNRQQFHKASKKSSGDAATYLGAVDFESVLEFWNILVSIHETAMHTKILETLICCFGLCIRRFTDLLGSILVVNPAGKSELKFSPPHDFTRCTLLYERIQYFVSLVRDYSDASQQVHLRKAAAQSLVVSGLLEQAELVSSSLTNCGGFYQENRESHFEPVESVNMFAYLILDTWFTCIKLLEDEDDDLRKDFALDIQTCFPEKFRELSHAGLVPSQVEKVIELSFNFLTSVFGHWDEYFNYLLRWVLDAASYAVPKGDLVRRVFDKEIDNHHEEKLLVCQLCCFHLEKIHALKSHKPEFLNLLRTWRAKFFHQLTSFAKDYIEKVGRINWIGGIGNHRDALLPLYGNLLGLYALSKCSSREGTEDCRCLPSDMVELEKLIRPFLKNPLVCNLYLSLTRLDEESVGRAADNFIPETASVGQMWDGFNPYFLLS